MGQPMIYDHSSDPEVLAGEYFLNQDQLFVRARSKMENVSATMESSKQ